MVLNSLFRDDAALWNAFRQGDSVAFEQIYRLYSAVLISYGKRLCTDHDRVRDAVQDVFVEIHQRRATLRDLDTIKFYLFRVLRNRLLGLQKADPFFRAESLDVEASDLLSLPFETALIDQETDLDRATRLRRAITGLPARQREALTLAFFHDFSNEEIAELMSINRQSVHNHLNRALTALREAFGGMLTVGLIIELLGCLRR